MTKTARTLFTASTGFAFLLMACSESPFAPPVTQDWSNVIQVPSQGKQDPSQVKQDSTQVKQDSTQVKQDSTQVKQDSTQVKQDSIPVKQDSIPVKQDSIPVKQDSIPAKQDSIPIKQDSSQVTQEPPYIINAPPQVTRPERFGSYLIRENTLRLTTDAGSRQLCDFGVSRTESYSARTDEFTFSFKKDTLFLVSASVQNSQELGMAGTGLVSENVSLYLRQAGGPGPEGRWRYIGSQVRIVSGTPTGSMRAHIENLNQGLRTRAELSFWELEFMGGEYRVGEKTSWASFEVASLKGQLIPDSLPILGDFEMEVRALDSDRVEYKGLKTGEKVVAFFHTGDWVDYSSDNPLHPPYSVGRDGVCPASLPETWIEAFFAANRKGA